MSFWDSLALITEEVVAGVSERVLVLDENDELEGNGIHLRLQHFAKRE